MMPKINDRRILKPVIFSGLPDCRVLATLFLIFLFCGCQTTSSVQGEGESREDVQEALSAIAGALSGKKLSDKELRDLERQIREDKEAQSAIQSITESVGGQAPVVKYCPVTGRRYAPHMELCPEHGVTLEIVEP